MQRDTRAGYLAAIAGVAAATAGALVFRGRLGTIDVAMLYLLAVVAVGARFRGGPALLAAGLGVAVFDFCFVPPYYTFNVHDSRYWLTFAVMLTVALVMGRLTARIREQADAAAERERLTAAMYAFNQDLAGAADAAAVRAVAARHLARAVRAPVTATLLPTPAGEDGSPTLPAGPEIASVDATLVADLALRRGASAGWGTEGYPEGEELALPLRTGGRVVGVAVVRPARADAELAPGERAVLEALAAETATALERVAVTERHEAARIELETERLRTALLSALSHDLRSPLSTIEGAASSLTRDDGTLPAGVRLDLAETILDESRRMHRMVGNLLDMVRVEAGLLAVHRSWQPVEEALGVALIRLDRRLAGHPVTTALDPGLPLVAMDELLIEQVYVNLLENAVKFTPAGTPIRIAARPAGDVVEITVADGGAGIPPDEREAVFRRFYRGRGSTEAVGGSGLGLAICRGIVSAHGGRIWIEEATGGGTAVKFTLPVGGEAPTVPEAPAESPG